MGGYLKALVDSMVEPSGSHTLWDKVGRSPDWQRRNHRIALGSPMDVGLLLPRLRLSQSFPLPCSAFRSAVCWPDPHNPCCGRRSGMSSS